MSPEAEAQSLNYWTTSKVPKIFKNYFYFGNFQTFSKVERLVETTM